MSRDTFRLLAAACVLGLVAAGLVWYLESFEREKLAAEWHAWVEEWQRNAGAGAPE